MRLLTKLLFIASFALLALPSSTLAHGSVHALKHILGEHIISVTPNNHDPQAGTPIKFNMRIYNIDGQLLAFKEVQLQVKQGAESLFSQSAPHSEFNDAEIEYTFPKQGNYTLTFTFMGVAEQLASTDFPIAVAPGANENSWAGVFNVQTFIAFLLGAGIATLYLKRAQLKPLLARLQETPAKNKRK